MKRQISNSGLLFTSVSAILGSGWLFGAYYAASFAGPASILSWVIGGLMIIVVAFVFAEVCTMVPVTGSSTRIPHLTHGTMTSFIFSWIIWLTYLALGPTELQAVLQYLSAYFPSLMNEQGALSTHGFVIAAGLLFIICTINFFSIRWLTRLNSFLTIFKIIIPLIVSLVILAYFFEPVKVIHSGGSTFAPFGLHGVLIAISAGGVIFTFNAFKLAAEVAGEAKNPKFALPFAIIGSVVICMILYLLLQTAFLSSITPKLLEHGWKNIGFANKLGPFSSIAHLDNLSILNPLILVGAIIGPFAAALVYCTSASRSIYAMSENGYVPALFQKVTTNKNPIYGIVIFFVLGLLMFAPFQGWQAMVQFLTSLLAITYVIAPVNCYTMRDKLPNFDRPFKLPFGKAWSLLAFFFCTLMVYWTGWETISKACFLIMLGLGVIFIYRLTQSSSARFSWNIKESLWFWAYLVGLLVISYCGNYGDGLGYISGAQAAVLLFVLCFVIIRLASKLSLSSAEMTQRIQNAIELDQKQ